MQVNALTKEQKIAQIRRLYGEGKLTFKQKHELTVPLYEK